MPSKSDTITIKIKELKKSCKLTDMQKEDIKLFYFINSYSIHSMSKLFKVSRRLIQFILFPERQQRSLELRKAKGGSMFYYDKNKHTEATKKHRRYKKELYKKGLIK